MFKQLSMIFLFFIFIFSGYSAQPEYVSVELYNLTKLSTSVIELKFGNGTDISPCSIYINDVLYGATYSGGFCSYNITDFPTEETTYTFKGVYNTNVNMTQHSFTYFPTAQVVAEVSAMSFVSLLISVTIIFFGVFFL